MSSSALTERSGAVRTITLNRADKRNALNRELLLRLHDLFDEQPPDDERVTVVRAEGPVFCAGLDLSERLDPGTPSSSGLIEATLASIENYPLPVVARVQGDAIAGGNELALHCDFVVASTRAHFGMSLAQIGLAPSWFLAKKLLEVGGPVLTREVLLLGDPVPAPRMAAAGVIMDAVPPHRLDDVVDAVVARLAANAPLSLRAIKALLVRQMTFRDHIDHADVDDQLDIVRRSDDAAEGVAARLQKRAPLYRSQ